MNRLILWRPRHVLSALACLALISWATGLLADESEGEIIGTGSDQSAFQFTMDRRLLEPRVLNEATEHVADVLLGIAEHRPWSEHIQRWIGQSAKRQAFWQEVKQRSEQLVTPEPPTPSADSLYIASNPGQITLPKTAFAAYFDELNSNLPPNDAGLVLFLKNSADQLRLTGEQNLTFIVGPRPVRINMSAVGLFAVVGGYDRDTLICGGRRTCFISAGPGDDMVIGGAANDVLNGDEGDDLIDGGAGNDLIRGGAGNDQLLGGIGDDVIDGGPGNDQIFGGAGNDVFAASPGNDKIHGGPGIDLVVFTGRSSDYHFVRMGRNQWRVFDRRQAGDGFDELFDIERVSFSNSQRVDIAETSLGIPIEDELELRELRLVDADGDWHIYSLRPEQLLSNDLSPSGAKLRLRALHDSKGGELRKAQWGFFGNFKYSEQPDGHIHIGVSSHLLGNLTQDHWVRLSYFIEDETGRGAARSFNKGNPNSEEMRGAFRIHIRIKPAPVRSTAYTCTSDCAMPNNYQMLQMQGNKNAALLGGRGNDTLVGDDSNNELNGAEGADRMVGGKGNDSYWVNDPKDQVIEQASEGFDTVYSSVAEYWLPEHVERLVLLPSARVGHGNALDNELIAAYTGAKLFGGHGNDHLSGGEGDDELDGGPGQDYLIGGKGNNIYRLGAQDGHDTWLDMLPQGTHVLRLKADLYGAEPHLMRIGKTVRIQFKDSSFTAPLWFDDRAIKLDRIEDAAGNTLYSRADIERLLINY
jgi:Ca2+-binding RTX toxin-like protein